MTLLALAVEQSRTSIKTINPKPQTLKPAILSTGLGFVDVRDVAQAHSLALLDPRAKGRYIAVSHSLNFLEMVRRQPPYCRLFLRHFIGTGCGGRMLILAVWAAVCSHSLGPLHHACRQRY